MMRSTASVAGVMVACGTLLSIQMDVLADDLVPAPWRGEANTTFQEATFGESWAVEWESVSNPFGAPDIWMYSDTWQWDETREGRSGVVSWGSWQNGFSMSIPNDPDPNREKRIWVQVTYYGTGPTIWEAVGMGPGGGIWDGGVPPLEGRVDHGDGWVTEARQMIIQPNPAEEFVGIRWQGTGVVDQIIVETMCVPEPQTLLLLAVGGLVLLWRRTRTTRRLAVAAVVSALAVVTAPVSAATPYTVTDLGPLPDGFHTTGYGINSSGQVAGVCTLADDRAVRWTNGVPRDLGSWGGWSKAYGISHLGAVVGTADYPLYHYGRAFIWTEALGMRELDNALTPPGMSSDGRAVSNYGVAGSTQIEGGGWRAFLWADNQMRNLGTLAENEPSYAYDISNNVNVMVVGRAGLAEEGVMHAMAWTEATGMVDLGSLGGRQSQALGVNDAGDVVGWSWLDDPYGTLHAFLHRNGVMQDLGALGGAALYSEAHAINNLGQIVGITHDAMANWVPALWENGDWYDLNTLIPPDSGWLLMGANDINDAGQITGVGYFDDPYLHAFLLTPVPEPEVPSLLAVAGLGLAGAALIRRRSLGRP